MPKPSKARVKNQKAVEIPAIFAPVSTAFAGNQQVALDKGWGAGNVVLKVKGKIFAMLVSGRLVAKLPRQRVNELVAAGQGERFEPRPGREMKEWISVEPGKAPWVELARQAYHFLDGSK